MIFIKLNHDVPHDMAWNPLQGNFSNSMANLILENFPMNWMLWEIVNQQTSLELFSYKKEQISLFKSRLPAWMSSS